MTARIVYLSWPATEISGGIKQAFRHVETLCAAGLDAVVATSDAKPPGWFATSATVIDISQAGLADDILVFPENQHPMLRTFASRPNRKLVFCQNPFMVARGLNGLGDYREFGVSGIFCTGTYAADFCRLRFPSLPVAAMPVVVDHNLFCLQGEKKLQIAFSPRKRRVEAVVIRDLFCARNPAFRAIPWIEIHGIPERQVAAVLSESAVYLALCRFEACPLTILEAFASGCITAGFTGFGARQYATAKNGFWAGEDDCFECAERLAQAVRLAAEGGSKHRDMLEAAQASARYFDGERLARCLLDYWRGILVGAL